MAGRWTDERVESILGALLRTGVILAAAVVSVGGAVYLVRHGSEPVHYSAFHAVPRVGTAGWHGRSIIQLGLLLLVATPVLRVFFSVLAFALQRDRTYVIVTSVVLTILLLSLTGGRAG